MSGVPDPGRKGFCRGIDDETRRRIAGSAKALDRGLEPVRAALILPTEEAEKANHHYRLRTSARSSFSTEPTTNSIRNLSSTRRRARVRKRVDRDTSSRIALMQAAHARASSAGNTSE